MVASSRLGNGYQMDNFSVSLSLNKDRINKEKTKLMRPVSLCKVTFLWFRNVKWTSKALAENGHIKCVTSLGVTNVINKFQRSIVMLLWIKQMIGLKITRLLWTNQRALYRHSITMLKFMTLTPVENFLLLVKGVFF